MKWIISNHKEGLTKDKINSYVSSLNDLSKDNINLIICANEKQLPFFKGGNYFLGSQNYAKNLDINYWNNLGVRFVLVGHADNRKDFNETNEEVNKKIKELTSNNIIPILCIGEDSIDSDIYDSIYKELRECLSGLNISTIIIAYEPIWAINTGKTPNIKTLNKVLKKIKKDTKHLLGINPIIVYGGSVNQDTISKLKKAKVDGYLLGRASLEIEELKRVIEVIS